MYDFLQQIRFIGHVRLKMKCLPFPSLYGKDGSQTFSPIPYMNYNQSNGYRCSKSRHFHLQDFQIFCMKIFFFDEIYQMQ